MSEKHTPKNIPQNGKIPKLMILGCPKVRERTGKRRTFHHFSASGVPGTSWVTPGDRNSPKTSPKSLRDPPWVSIFSDFRSICDARFWSSLSLCGFVFFEPSTRQNKERSRHGGGDGPQGNWIYIYIYIYIYTH